MNDPFVEQVMHLCREERYRAKWIIVPTPSLRWTLGERLLLEGCDWMNLRFVTPFQLALESVAGKLLTRGINPSPETLGPSLIQLLFLRQECAQYFRPLILQPGMAESLWAALLEFRMAGLTSADLKKLDSGPKRSELSLLFRDYESYLSEHKLADRAMIFKEAGQIEAIQVHDLVLPFPYTVWSPLEQSLIDKLAGERLIPCATSQALPRRASLPRLAMTAAPLAPPELFYAPRRSDEIDEILRRLKSRQLPLDQVEIAADASESALLFDRCQAAGLPVTFESGLPIETSRAHQALAGILTWVEHGYTAYHLRELLLSGSLQARPYSFAAANLLEAAQIGWGREQYLRQLEALRQYSLERAARDETRRDRLIRQAEQIVELTSWLSELFRRLPMPDAAGTFDLGRWVDGLGQLLQELPGEDGGSTALLSALRELKVLGSSQRWPWEQALNLIRQRLRVLRWRASRPRPGHLHVTRPELLGLSGRSTLFLIGLEEGRLLPTVLEDCVFDDEERRQLHPSLRLSGDRPQEFLFDLRERLATYEGQLTFSFACRDRAGDQEQWPSWLFFEAARQHFPHLKSYDELLDVLGEPLRQQPRRPLSPTAQSQLFPDLGLAAQAIQQRASKDFTVYDGFVPAAAGVWDPRTSGMAVSASRLSGLATCPFRTFLELGLGLSRSPLALPDPDSWLDAATRGTVLHEVYAEYYRGLRARGWEPQLERDRSQLFELLKEQLERVRAVLPPPSSALEKAETASLKRDLDYFLSLELGSSQRTPVALEVPFGLGDDPREILARSQPILLDLGPDLQFAFHGRIDRIDKVPEGYAIVDYKTGRKLLVSRDGVFEKGRLLQHALYALAAEQLLGGAEIVQTSYYFPTSGAARPWIHFNYPDKSRLARVLTQVMEPLRTGAFVHSHKSDSDCQYCDFRAACRGHRDELTRPKLENPANQLLTSRRLLLEEA